MSEGVREWAHVEKRGVPLGVGRWVFTSRTRRKLTHAPAEPSRDHSLFFTDTGVLENFRTRAAGPDAKKCVLKGDKLGRHPPMAWCSVAQPRHVGCRGEGLTSHTDPP